MPFKLLSHRVSEGQPVLEPTYLESAPISELVLQSLGKYEWNALVLLYFRESGDGGGQERSSLETPGIPSQDPEITT